MTRSPLLVHCHMPKTAGSALNRRVFLPRFDQSRVWLAYGVKIERRRTLEVEEGPARPAFIAGHIPFGFADPLEREVVHVSILRDPVDRVVSFLNYVAVADRHGARRKFEEDMQALALKDPSRFAEMILSQDHVRIRQSNTMVRLASGMPRLGKRKPGYWRLGVAMKRLHQPDYLVGLQDRFDEFAAFLADYCDERGIGRRARATATDDDADKRFDKVIRLGDLSAKTLEMIRGMNSLDMRFFETADLLWDRREIAA
ncbi:MAG: hypothetical protein AAFN79_10020 [Pseudomonadota bacterium]